MEEIIIITVIKLKSWATRSDRLEGNQIIREGEHSTPNKLNVDWKNELIELVRGSNSRLCRRTVRSTRERARKMTRKFAGVNKTHLFTLAFFEFHGRIEIHRARAHTEAIDREISSRKTDISASKKVNNAKRNVCWKRRKGRIAKENRQFSVRESLIMKSLTNSYSKLSISSLVSSFLCKYSHI